MCTFHENWVHVSDTMCLFSGAVCGVCALLALDIGLSECVWCEMNWYNGDNQQLHNVFTNELKNTSTNAKCIRAVNIVAVLVFVAVAVAA